MEVDRAKQAAIRARNVMKRKAEKKVKEDGAGSGRTQAASEGDLHVGLVGVGSHGELKFVYNKSGEEKCDAVKSEAEKVVSVAVKSKAGKSDAVKS